MADLLLHIASTAFLLHVASTKHHIHTPLLTRPPCACSGAGPTIKFHCDGLVALAGAEFDVTLDDEPVAWWSSFKVAAGGGQDTAGTGGELNKGQEGEQQR
jgi:hypothetical protein